MKSPEKIQTAAERLLKACYALITNKRRFHNIDSNRSQTLHSISFKISFKIPEAQQIRTKSTKIIDKLRAYWTTSDKRTTIRFFSSQKPRTATNAAERGHSLFKHIKRTIQWILRQRYYMHVNNHEKKTLITIVSDSLKWCDVENAPQSTAQDLYLVSSIKLNVFFPPFFFSLVALLCWPLIFHQYESLD